MYMNDILRGTKRNGIGLIRIGAGRVTQAGMPWKDETGRDVEGVSHDDG